MSNTIAPWLGVRSHSSYRPDNNVCVETTLQQLHASACPVVLILLPSNSISPCVDFVGHHRLIDVDSSKY
jgi:hypothetical protein